MLEKRRSNLNIAARLVRVISFYLVARLAVNNEPRDRRGSMEYSLTRRVSSIFNARMPRRRISMLLAPRTWLTSNGSNSTDLSK